MASKTIKSTDPEYSTIHADWVYNGRASTFTRQGSWGGALYQVIDTGAEEPDIYQVHSIGPTLFDEESAAEKPYQEGWHLVNRNYWQQKVWTDRKGRWRTKTSTPPNELAMSQTV